MMNFWNMLLQIVKAIWSLLSMVCSGLWQLIKLVIDLFV